MSTQGSIISDRTNILRATTADDINGVETTTTEFCGAVARVTHCDDVSKGLIQAAAR